MPCRQPVAAACRSGLILLVASVASSAWADEPAAPRLLGADHGPNPAVEARPLPAPLSTETAAEPPLRGPILLPPGFVIGPARAEVVVSFEAPAEVAPPGAVLGPSARRGWQAAGGPSATRVDPSLLPVTCCEPAGLTPRRGAVLAGAVAGGVAESLGGRPQGPAESRVESTSAAAVRMARAAGGEQSAAAPTAPEPTSAIARTILDLMQKTGPSVIDGSAFDVPEPGCAADAAPAPQDRRLAILEELLRLERAAASGSPRPLQVVRAERPGQPSTAAPASPDELDLQTRLNWFELAVRLETMAETLERGGDAESAAELRSVAARARNAMRSEPATAAPRAIDPTATTAPAAVDLARQVADLRMELGRIRATLGLRDQDRDADAEPGAAPAAQPSTGPWQGLRGIATP